MKVIKTIVKRLDNAEEFDDAVNGALKDGWILRKRRVLQSGQPISTTYYHTMLYAELVKEENDESKSD